MSTSQTTTTTTFSCSNPHTGPSNLPVPPPPSSNTGRQKAAHEVREQAIWARQQEEEVVEQRRLFADAVTTRSQRGTSPTEMSASPRRPVMEIRRMVKSKGKGKAWATPVGGDPDDGDGDDNNNDKEDQCAPCKQCRSKKIPCQMQAGKRSSIICKPCHNTKVQCLYSGRPSTLKQEEGANPTGERLAVLESQVAQLLADNWYLREGQMKANMYHRHFNQKLDWLIMDATRRRSLLPSRLLFNRPGSLSTPPSVHPHVF
ncbi:hypothetical protein F5879DRAFT_927366 [Lentinula edodes]|nr:hypothetical protein F5879DRAFT_927366 [Lentinula edodes]